MKLSEELRDAAQVTEEYVGRYPYGSAHGKRTLENQALIMRALAVLLSNTGTGAAP